MTAKTKSKPLARIVVNSKRKQVFFEYGDYFCVDVRSGEMGTWKEIRDKVNSHKALLDHARNFRDLITSDIFQAEGKGE